MEILEINGNSMEILTLSLKQHYTKISTYWGKREKKEKRERDLISYLGFFFFSSLSPG